MDLFRIWSVREGRAGGFCKPGRAPAVSCPGAPGGRVILAEAAGWERISRSRDMLTIL